MVCCLQGTDRDSHWKRQWNIPPVSEARHCSSRERIQALIAGGLRSRRSRAPLSMANPEGRGQDVQQAGAGPRGWRFRTA
jgi:hypothetical protein